MGFEMLEFPKLGEDPSAFVGSCGARVKEIIGQAAAFSRGFEVVLALKQSEGLEKRLLPAYIAAAIKMNCGTMKAKSMPLEMLSLLANTNDIRKAAAMSADDNCNFVLFSSSSKLERQIMRKLGIRIGRKWRLTPLDLDECSRIAAGTSSYGAHGKGNQES